MSGAWRNSAGELCFVSGVKPGVYSAVDAPLAKVPGVVGKNEGHPFNPKGPSVGDWARRTGVPGLESQMLNKVKKCAKCGKPNAFTLTACNSCGARLPEQFSHTPNLFACIVYGFDAVGLSLRAQNKECLVIDDLLSLSACHLNAIWARDHVPSVVDLFAIPPREALYIVRAMKAACEKVFLEQFVNHPTFYKRYVRDRDAVADPLQLVAMGYNTPPSQYQLHLQYIAIPLIPFQHAQNMKGNHFTHNRFLPWGYVEKALKAIEAAGGLGMRVASNTKIEAIIAKVDGLGVNYTALWQAETRRYLYLQEQHGNFQPANFDDVTEVSAADATAVADKDKLVLQSYGRPYNAEGRPDAANHYSLAKRPGEFTPPQRA